jgi:hypothetical protein
MPAGLIAVGYMIKYGFLVAYGVHSLIFRVPSFVAVGGDSFAIWWAGTVLVLASLALVAVFRTWFTGRKRYEKWATAGFVLTMLIYSIVLVVRSTVLGDAAGSSAMWLPVSLSVFPTIRYFWLVNR